MKVGKFQIPEYRLNDELVDALKKIYDKYKSEEATDHNTIAMLIGHKSPSGPYYVKIASLRSFGLLERRGVKVTQLGKTIAYPRSEDERDDSFKEALLNVPLWKLFFTEFGVNLPKEKFWVDLQRIAGIEAPDAQKLENPVRNAYIGDAKNLKTVETPIKPPESDQTKARGGGESDRKPNMGSSQAASTVSPSISTGGNFPILYDPELGASIVIDTPRKFQAAKIFWEAIAAEWEKKLASKINGPKDEPTDQKQPPLSVE
jgi:hypothetical protein